MILSNQQNITFFFEGIYFYIKNSTIKYIYGGKRMQITFETIDNALIIKLSGELDHHSSEYIKEKIDLEIMSRNPKNIIFDMENLSFMDSSGVGVIIGRYKFISSKGGKAAIVNLKPQIKRIYEICGLKKIIPNFSTSKTAIEKL